SLNSPRLCSSLFTTRRSSDLPVILEGLSRLEYRGYDSAGIAVFDGEKIRMEKAAGRLKVLDELTDHGKNMPGTCGIGHTRWATQDRKSTRLNSSHVSISYDVF